jgi:hypothetical protein
VRDAADDGAWLAKASNCVREVLKRRWISFKHEFVISP